MLECVGVCCSVMQTVAVSWWESLCEFKPMRHAATCCNMLQHAATHCNTLQHTATHCNAWQRTTTHCIILHRTATHGGGTAYVSSLTLPIAVRCSVSQCMLQRVAACCSVLQYDAECCCGIVAGELMSVSSHYQKAQVVLEKKI